MLEAHGVLSGSCEVPAEKARDTIIISITVNITYTQT